MSDNGKQLELEVLAQPHGATAVYRYFGFQVPLEGLIEEVEPLPGASLAGLGAAFQSDATAAVRMLAEECFCSTESQRAWRLCEGA